MRLTSPNEIRALMERHGVRFSKGLGQNFLIEPSVPRRIAEAGCEGGDSAGLAVLEVGPGVGCLTAELAQRAGRVEAVELDKLLLPLLAETLAEHPNAEVVPGDALKLDLAALMRERCPGMRYRVCANLPYNVTTPLLAKFIDAGIFEAITVMMQREVALRLAAAPGTSDYGAFSVYLGWHCEAERLFDVPPECFMPRPKVTSSVVRLSPRPAPPCPVRDEALMFRCVKAAFAQRRKTLRNALGSGLGEYGPLAPAALERAGIDPGARGETLSAADFARLADALGYILTETLQKH